MGFSSTVTTNLAKLRGLSPVERSLLGKAAVCLPLIHAGLLLLGYRRTRRVMETLLPLKPVEMTLPDMEVLRRARGIAQMVAIAGQHGLYRASCLRRSLLVWGLLRREGVQSRICFGVRMSDRQLEAHAWLEYKGMVLNDSLAVHNRYTALHEAFPPTRSGL